MKRFRPSVISIHDVMPDTLDRVERIISQELTGIPPSHILLLVVPGLDWTKSQIQRLKKMQQEGYEIAGHGWVHFAQEIRTPYHRLHSFFISRRAAEHLSKNEQELVQLLSNNLAWFKQHDFELPKFYVPPAWAMGRIRRKALQQFSFHSIECTSGFINLRTGRKRFLPLVGFEADTRLRALFLQLWNRINGLGAKAFRPLRISIHPYDDEYLIANQMRQFIQEARTVHWSMVWNPETSLAKFDESHNNVSV